MNFVEGTILCHFLVPCAGGQTRYHGPFWLSNLLNRVLPLPVMELVEVTGNLGGSRPQERGQECDKQKEMAFSEVLLQQC